MRKGGSIKGGKERERRGEEMEMERVSWRWVRGADRIGRGVGFRDLVDGH